MNGKIIHGDCLQEMKALPDNSVDIVCTDPPYGIGFMGKAWDTFSPEYKAKMQEREAKRRPRSDGRTATGFQDATYAGSYDYSKSGRTAFADFMYLVGGEILRVLKPGAFLFMTMTPRQDCLARVQLALEDAGFDIGFTPMFWTYASGFPKAMNIGKAVDKRLGAERRVTGKNPNGFGRNTGSSLTHNLEIHPDLTAPATPQAKTLDGSYGGFQPKPAVEVIIVAMKPLTEKTFVDQALNNGKGVTWLHDCRVPSARTIPGGGKSKRGHAYLYNDGQASTNAQPHDSGRFPANLLVSDDVLNDGHLSKGVSAGGPTQYGGVGDWDNALNRQPIRTFFADDGSYSRYFDLDAWAQTLPFLIVPKASKSEKNQGTDLTKGKYQDDARLDKDAMGANNPRNRSGKMAMGNFHPTVKPLKLMSYLITLGSRPGDVVLDPFLGSGTTAIAAQILERNWVGIEREDEYVEIAKARLSALPIPQPNLFGEEKCLQSQSKKQTTKPSSQPDKKSTNVFPSWSGPPLKS